MHLREQRDIIKQWKQCSKKYRDKIKQQQKFEIGLLVNTPPLSPDLRHEIPIFMSNNQPSTSRVEICKKKQKGNRNLMRKEIKELKEQNETLKKQVDKYRKRLQRSKSPGLKNTLRRKVERMLKGVCCSNEVTDNLVIREVLRKQIRNNFDEESNLNKKRCVAKLLVGKMITKYKMM